MRECGGVGDCWAGFAARRAAMVWVKAIVMHLELCWGSEHFANNNGAARKTRGFEGQEIVGEGLVTYRAQGWAATSA